MKTKRFLLAAAIAMAAAACSGDVTAPDPAARAPGSGHASTSGQETEASTAAPEAAEEDGGTMGSGVGR